MAQIYGEMAGHVINKLFLAVFLLAALAGLAGCGASKRVSPVVYDCDGGVSLSATYDLDARRIHIVYGALDLDLPQTQAADGARFSDDLSTFWDHGREATLQLAASPRPITCHIRP